MNAPLGLKHGLRGPNGFNSGQAAGLLLDRIAFPVSEVASFDDLPTPFRCVATDMQTGEAVVLQNGSLSQAVRASMAIPGVFTPVEMNGRVLADGTPAELVQRSRNHNAVRLGIVGGADANVRAELAALPGVADET